MAFNAQRYDTKAFTEGTWTEVLGGQFKLARAGNPTYEKAMEDGGYRKAKTPESKERALYKAVAEGILKDWSDVQDAEGKDIPYSIENVITVLQENPDLVSEVLSKANDLDEFLRTDVEEQAAAAVDFTASSKSG